LLDILHKEDGQGLISTGNAMQEKSVTNPERRTRTTDRRQRERMPRVPFRDSNGDIVAVDRRYLPDRRLARLKTPPSD
jgi:hypothetical protein